MVNQTVITFIKDDRVVEVEGFVPNVQVGQIFAFDHPQMKRGCQGIVENIQHAINLDGELTTYIDVS